MKRKNNRGLDWGRVWDVDVEFYIWGLDPTLAVTCFKEDVNAVVPVA